jgi:hypothetical protein
LWAQLLKRRVAYGNMGCGAMNIRDNNFLAAYATSKKIFLALNAENGFFAI